MPDTLVSATDAGGRKFGIEDKMAAYTTTAELPAIL